MTSINRDRTRYPINEPIFPHWSNMGAVLDEEMAEDQAKREREGDTAYVPRWKWMESKSDLIQKDFGRWRYMEMRFATPTDATKRKCMWCENKDNGQETILFHKNDIVVREHVSQSDFTSLHPQCALEKLIAVKENMEKGIEKLEGMIYQSHGNINNGHNNRPRR
jgi:hypothetical protein